MTDLAAPPPGALPAEERDILLAIRNAFKLGGSLAFTWSIAIAMRLVLPRYLGPVRLGTLTFADAFTIAFFVALGLGADQYIRKEVSVRPAHASDFFGGLLVLRVFMTVGIFTAMAAVLHLSQRPPEVRALVYTFGVAQCFAQTNATLSALLHARGNVGEMSVLAVATKVVWAVGLLLAMGTHQGLWAYATAYLVSEAIETLALFHLARKHLDLIVRVDIAATTAMVLAGLPYYLHSFAIGAYGKLDLTLLAFLASDREVGWYAAASTVAGFTLMAAPLLEWIVMPVFARAANRSRGELDARVRATTEVVLMVAIPVSLLVVLGAREWVRLLFGAPFAPATAALRILAATFVLTYVGILYGTRLIMLGRAWTLTWIGVAGLGVNALLNILLVGPCVARFGDGGGGVGCALALLGTEVLVTSAMLVIAGRASIDRSTASTISKSVFAAVVVVAIDRGATSLGWVRLAIDASVYLVIAAAIGAQPARKVAAAITSAIKDGKAGG